MPTKEITDLILYIIPGFVARSLFISKYPAKKISTFSETAYSLLYGVFIFSLVKWVDQGGWLLKSDKTGFPDYRFVLALFVTAYFAGWFFILLNELKTTLGTSFKQLNFLIPDPGKIWNKINSEDVTDWAVIYLKDGSIYSGKIEYYSYDPDEENQDFLLAIAERVDEDLKTQYTIDGIGVYMNTRDINKIEFLKADPSPEKN